MCQGKGAKLVKDVDSVRDCRKQPIEVFFIDILREGRDDAQKLPGIRTKSLEQRRSEQKFNSSDRLKSRSEI